VAEDYVNTLGMAVLPHHVRRMLDCFLSGEGEPATEDGIVHAPGKASSMMRLLDAHGPLGILDISARLGLSHPLIIGFAKTLLADGLVSERRSPTDGRVRLLALTDAGRIEAAHIQRLHARLESVYRGLCEEVGIDLFQLSLAVQAALENKSLADRLAETKQSEDDSHVAY
jgi:DNA-binding MarR family transcriptional regulator